MPCVTNSDSAFEVSEWKIIGCPSLPTIISLCIHVPVFLKIVKYFFRCTGAHSKTLTYGTDGNSTLSNCKHLHRLDIELRFSYIRLGQKRKGGEHND